MLNIQFKYVKYFFLKYSIQVPVLTLMKKEKQTGVCYSRHVMIMIPLCDLLILFFGHMVSVSVPVRVRSRRVFKLSKVQEDNY